MIREFVVAHRAFTVMLVFVVVGGLVLALWLPDGVLGLVCTLGYGIGFGIYLSLAAVAAERMQHRPD